MKTIDIWEQTTSQSINHHRHRHHHALMLVNLFQIEWIFLSIDTNKHIYCRSSQKFEAFRCVHTVQVRYTHTKLSLHWEMVAMRWQIPIQIHIWQHQFGICNVITWGLGLSENSRNTTAWELYVLCDHDDKLNFSNNGSILWILNLLPCTHAQSHRAYLSIFRFVLVGVAIGNEIYARAENLLFYTENKKIPLN